MLFPVAYIKEKRKRFLKEMFTEPTLTEYGAAQTWYEQWYKDTFAL